ncbi:hypothetical protein ACQ7CD_24050, partial [Escherichia coli]|uniref:hypothetical protein n=1 Tax=Escherichia coli TaxID=562 RepID=UPI003D33DFA8
YLDRSLIRIASLYHTLHETTARAVEKPECTLHCKHFRDEVKMNCDVVSTPSRRYPVRRNVAGLYPWWHWVLERENPRTLRGKT